MFTSFIRKTAVNDFIYGDLEHIGSINYEMGKKIEGCRVIQGCSQAKLANKIGLTYQEIHQFELGYKPITIKKLYLVVEALSVNVIDLLPEPTVLKESSWYEDEEIVYLAKIYREIKDQELHKKFYPLIRFVYVSEKMSQEKVKIEVAKSLVKEGVSFEIISQATGLSTYEYNDIEEEICTDSILYKVGQKIKERRLILKYTQKDLAKKIGSTPKEIHHYERGYIDITIDRLYDIAKALSVNIKVLLQEPTDEDSKNLLSLIGGDKNIENQESRDVLDAAVRSLSKGIQTGKEKIKKAEKIMVAKNLVEAGIAVDIILRTTGLTADELDAS